jgi:hypothetical protein
MPATVYNITSNNNSISITEGATTVSVSITPGLYNINSLLVTLGAALTADGTLTGTYTATLDALTQRVVISCSTNFTVNPDSAPSSLASMLGYTSPQSQSGSITALELYDISPIREIYIACDLPIRSYFNSEIRSILCKVPLVTGSFGDLLHITYDSSESSIQFEDTQHVNSIQLTLVDAYGRTVDLNGVEYSLEIAFTRIVPDDIPAYLQ